MNIYLGMAVQAILTAVLYKTGMLKEKTIISHHLTVAVILLILWAIETFLVK